MVKHVHAKVVGIENFGSAAYRISLDVGKGKIFYRPGQFLHLALDEFDQTNGYWPESRVFSIVSLKANGLLDLVYSVKGMFTRRMELELDVGRDVWIKLPYGDFVIDEESNNELCLVAGGTGIAPFVTFLERLLASHSAQRKIHIHYGAKFENLLFYRPLIDRLKHQFPLIEVNYYVEETASANVIHGRIDPEKLVQSISDLGSTDYFLSGPPAMLEFLRTNLLKMNIQRDHIHIDEWE